MPVLRLVSMYMSWHVELLDALAAQLARVLGVSVEVRPPSFDPEIAFDAARGQYNSTVLLAQLLREPPGAARLLGVTSVDLFIPVLTYVFGEAQLEGRAAIVSLRRLAPEHYGLAAAPELLLARLVKEAVHELGHTYGLVHCERSGCVMNRSTYVEEIDLKTEAFCPRCRDAARAGK